MFEKQIWISRVDVRPLSDQTGSPLKDMSGAIVNVLAIGQSERHVRSLVSKELAKDGFEVLTIEDLETLGTRLEFGHACKEIIELSKLLNEEIPVVYDTFFAYP